MFYFVSATFTQHKDFKIPPCNLFLFIAESYSIVWIYHLCLSSHLLMDFRIVSSLGILD